MSRAGEMRANAPHTIGWVNWGALAATVGLLVFTAGTLRDEWTVGQARAVGTVQLEGVRASHIPAMWSADRLDTVPARALLIRAQIFARSAFGLQPGIAREEQLRLAQASLTAAMAARPMWGEAKVVQTFINFVAYGLDAQATHDAFAISYAATRFSSDSGVWRVRLGIADWQHIDPGVRQHMIEEAVWLGNQSPVMDSLMRSIVADVPAALVQYWDTRKRYDFSHAASRT